ncbi:hypothetical protein EVAR_101783_1 [Eumeta japonica]|uniref:Uncharacterized protein n=1 Tax=Eumeta variegata TaxID=151549 RepID=A0A4C1SMM4_EUMVA|nr:hypothetical protein EVAR_101783_1 [Eumeta japonica]
MINITKPQYLKSNRRNRSILKKKCSSHRGHAEGRNGTNQKRHNHGDGKGAIESSTALRNRLETIGAPLCGSARAIELCARIDHSSIASRTPSGRRAPDAGVVDAVINIFCRN